MSLHSNSEKTTWTAFLFSILSCAEYSYSRFLNAASPPLRYLKMFDVKNKPLLFALREPFFEMKGSETMTRSLKSFTGASRHPVGHLP
jgi:hypothetical protein